jgi:nitroreductase
METMEAILTRRSIREYSSQAVPDELVKKILAAAMQAPSAGNQQPWHFVVVNERELLTALADGLPFAKMLPSAQLGIVVCADLQLEKYRGFWVQDCSNATMNILLAAHDQGLGAVWTAIYPVEDRIVGAKRILGLPEQVIPLCVVPIGYPASTPEPPARRYDETRLHRNRW